MPKRILELNEPLRIVTIGGGTGLSAVLHGLKGFVRQFGRERLEVTAVVTVTDDGGSSGRLRRDFDILPPGDIRNCMVALSEDEALLAKLFQYRFDSGRGLRGHSFGNLFLTALTHITGDFAQAIALSSEILATYGKLYPSTAENVSLEAKLEDGSKLVGESNISKSKSPIRSVSIKPKHCKPLPETLRAIEQADLICLGPGSLFTSVIPNLLVEGIPEAIERSQAIKVYFANIMTQPGETSEYTASMHVKAIYQHAGRNFLDVVVVNSSTITSALRKTYAAQHAYPVETDTTALKRQGVRVIKAELLADSIKVRHAAEATAQVALELALMSRSDRQALMNVRKRAKA